MAARNAGRTRSLGLTRWLVLGAVLLAGGLPAPAWAQPVAKSDEFQVNTDTADFQGAPGVGMDNQGNFVVVWSSFYPFGYGTYGYLIVPVTAVSGQRFDATGAPTGAEFQVNTFAPLNYYNEAVLPEVAMREDGRFVVVWQNYGMGGYFWINPVARLYETDGTAVGSEFLLSTYTSGDQLYPDVAMGPDGDFVASWSAWFRDGDRHGIWGRRFDSTGTPKGAEFQVNTYTTASQFDSSVATDDDGNSVVVWTSAYQDGSDTSVFGQRFDNTGATVDGEFRVNTHTTGYQLYPSVAMDPAGNFVVVWASYAGQDGDGDGVFAQRFDSEGSEVGGEFQVNTYTTENQSRPSVSMDHSGNFVVIWHSDLQDGSDYGVFGQAFDLTGATVGDEFNVNTFTGSSQGRPAVAMSAPGDFVVSWLSYQGLDASDTFGRRGGLALSELDTAICGTTAHYAWVEEGLGDDNTDVWYRSCTVGGSCSAATKLVGASSQERHPTVACSGSTVIVAWEDNRKGNSDIAYRRSADGGASFSPMKFLRQAATDETMPQLAMSGTVVFAVWQDTQRGNINLGYRRSADGGLTWSNFAFLVRSSFPDTDPSLDMSGNIAVLGYVDRRHGNEDIAYRRSADAGATWDDLKFLVSAGTPDTGPTVAVDGTITMVGWVNRKKGKEDLSYRRSTNSGVNFDSLRFLVTASTPDITPVLRLSGNDALLVWIDSRSGNQNVSIRHSANGGASFGSTTRLVAAPTDEYGPACSLVGGEATCAWSDYRSQATDPMYRDSSDGGQTWGPRKDLD